MRLLPEMRAEDIIRDKTAVEAGWVDDPDDLGGETNHGITRKTADDHRHLWGEYGWNGDMRTMPIELAYRIYYESWWKRMWCDRVDDLLNHRGQPIEGRTYLAERLFDFSINAGRKNGIRSLQRWLNALNRMESDYPDVNPDGAMGAQTFAALEAYCRRKDPEAMMKLVSLMHSSQNHHYLDISEKRVRNEKFTNGWVNRVWRDTKNYWYQFFSR